MAERVGHVGVDQTHQRNVARHGAVAHHMVDTLALHDDATKTVTVRKGVWRRCPDKRNIARRAGLAQQFIDLECRQPCGK